MESPITSLPSQLRGVKCVKSIHV